MADEATQKRCSKCFKVKPMECFSWSDRKRGYRNPACRECRNAQQRKWFSKNRDYKLMRNMEWYYANREHHIKRQTANRDPVQHRSYQARRRENGLYRNGRISVGYRMILERDGMVCWICSKEITTLTDLEFGHVVPLAKGGAHVPENIRPAHVRCNRSKGSVV